ncbi:ABC transporter permease [candidate division KSB1 bacterium]|nr:ABC transporter permease [candidate division KSB1 bacterium]
MWLIKFLFEIMEGFRAALQALVANKLRTFLTTLGIIIGITTVIGIHSIIQGLNEAFYTSISALGSDTLYIQKFSWFSHSDWMEARNRKDITMKEAKFIKKHGVLVEAVTPTVSTQRSVKFKNDKLNGVYVTGATEEYEITSSIDIEYGRFLSKEDVDHRRPVCIIGWEIADKLFDKISPLGRSLNIGGKNFRIIGIIPKRGSLFGMSLDSEVVIPIGAFYKIFGSRRWITIEVKVTRSDKIEDAKDELIELLRRVRKVPPGEPNDFAINQQDMIADMYKRLTTALYAVAFGVGTIALIVGGIGIMNILLVSVTERTREIGIRKAVGARRRDILWQFLVESIVVSAAGGILGILCGFLIAKVVASVSFLEASVSFSSMIIGIIFIGLVGLFFGIYPAYKASKLNPIDALRYE